MARDPHSVLLEQVKTMEKAIKGGQGPENEKAAKLRQLMVMRIRIQGMADENKARLQLVKDRNIDAVSKFSDLDCDVHSRHSGYGRLDCSVDGLLDAMDGSTHYETSTVTGSESWLETDEDRQTSLDSEFSDDGVLVASRKDKGPVKSTDLGHRVSVGSARQKAEAEAVRQRQLRELAELEHYQEQSNQFAFAELGPRPGGQKSTDPGKRVSVTTARAKAEEQAAAARQARSGPRKSTDPGVRVSVGSARAKAEARAMLRRQSRESLSSEAVHEEDEVGRMRTPSPECPSALRDLSFPFQATPQLC